MEYSTTFRTKTEFKARNNQFIGMCWIQAYPFLLSWFISEWRGLLSRRRDDVGIHQTHEEEEEEEEEEENRGKENEPKRAK